MLFGRLIVLILVMLLEYFPSTNKLCRHDILDYLLSFWICLPANWVLLMSEFKSVTNTINLDLFSLINVCLLVTRINLSSLPIFAFNSANIILIPWLRASV